MFDNSTSAKKAKLHFDTNLGEKIRVQ